MRRALKADPSLTETLSAGIDRGMGKLEMSVAKRFQLRQIFSQVGWRMQKQSTTTVIDEYVDKVVKASGQVASQAELERRIAAQIGQDAYWRHQNRLALMFADDPGGGGGSATASPIVPPGVGSGSAATSPSVAEMLLANARQAAARQYCETVEIIGKQLSELDPALYQREYLSDAAIIGCRQRRAADRAAIVPAAAGDCSNARALANKMAHDKVVGTGGWMLGISLITGVVGAVTASAGVGLVLLTIGAALLVGGLIVCIVGAAMPTD
ncbi:MAG: hypothetical protein JO257_24145 [Deltaproteobacteria bacterium]|nr:hypothetical protein [Deltaproteobacteria bacterium]